MQYSSTAGHTLWGKVDVHLMKPKMQKCEINFRAPGTCFFHGWHCAAFHMPRTESPLVSAAIMSAGNPVSQNLCTTACHRDQKIHTVSKPSHKWKLHLSLITRLTSSVRKLSFINSLSRQWKGWLCISSTDSWSEFLNTGIRANLHK